MQRMRAVVITGMAGAGKTTALRAFEDAGAYCIDNLPVPLLQAVLELSSQSTRKPPRVAVCMDARDREHIDRLPDTLASLRRQGYPVRLMFLEASDEVLVARFTATRHRHPAVREGGVLESVRAERGILGPLRRVAEDVVDTSRMSSNDLRKRVREIFVPGAGGGAMTVEVLSFGFKNGLPVNADLVLDVRFLPNPFFVESLKNGTGLDAAVSDYVLTSPDGSELLAEYERLLEFLMPRFAREGKSYVTVGIGCTGGRHRSVTVTEELARRMRTKGVAVTVSHRDVDRE